MRLTEEGRLGLFRSAPPEDVDRLRRTIESLRAAAGAGAVDVLRVTDDGERVELVLSFAGRSPSAPMRAHELAPLAAALAGHLSDLHLRGRAHGAVRIDHVLLDADRRVRLCGFGDTHAARPSDDVHAFGTLVKDLLDDDDRTATADALRTHADRCRAEAAARPTMAAIAASLASLDGRVRTVPVTTATTAPRRRWHVGAALATVLILAGALLARTRDSRADDRAVARRRVDVPVSTTSTAGARPPTRVWPSSLHGDGSTWELGDADDRTVLGDWNCDGIDTPALVERPAGAVYVIDRWPEVEVAARYVTTIPGVIDASRQRGERRCDHLVVVTDDGESIRVSLSA